MATLSTVALVSELSAQPDGGLMMRHLQRTIALQKDSRTENEVEDEEGEEGEEDKEDEEDEEEVDGEQGQNIKNEICMTGCGVQTLVTL